MHMCVCVCVCIYACPYPGEKENVRIKKGCPIVSNSWTVRQRIVLNLDNLAWRYVLKAENDTTVIIRANRTRRLIIVIFSIIIIILSYYHYRRITKPSWYSDYTPRNTAAITRSKINSCRQFSLCPATVAAHRPTLPLSSPEIGSNNIIHCFVYIMCVCVVVVVISDCETGCT